MLISKLFRRREQGSALLAVIGVMAVLVIVGAVVAAVTISAQGFTTSTRAGVQSSAAAEAGIDDTVMRIMKGSCLATNTGTDPAFTAKVYVSTSSSTPPPPSSWSNGPKCPGTSPGNSVKWVRIVSTGTASSGGVAGNTGLDKQTLEAVYAVSSGPSSAMSAGAVTSFTIPSVDNVTITGSSGMPADFLVANGDFVCNSNSTINGSVTAAQGAVDIGACSVTGTAKYATKFSGSGSVGKKEKIAPISVPWYNYQYDAAKWQEQGFYIYTLPKSQCSIGIQMIKNGIAAAISATGKSNDYKVVINALACEIENNYALQVQFTGTLELQGDVAVISQSFVLQNGLTITGKNGARKIYFLSPVSGDLAHVASDGSPVCDYNGWNSNKIYNAGNTKVLVDYRYNVNITAGITIGSDAAAFVYSPCGIENSSATWRGQIYGRTVAFRGNPVDFTAVNVGIPGTEIGGGGSGSGTLGARLYLRDYSG